METAASHGVCPVCGKNATLKCGNCKREFYCGRSHQSEDWPRHRSACSAWKVDHDPDLGRHLLATRDLAPGDVIISETPLVWGPSIHANQRLCVGCGRRCGEIDVRCGRCCWPACKPDCEGLFDKRRHELECALLASARIIPRYRVSYRQPGARVDNISRPAYFGAQLAKCLTVKFYLIVTHSLVLALNG